MEANLINKAVFKEIKVHGLNIWVCELNGKEIARALSQQMCRCMVLGLLRKNKSV